MHTSINLPVRARSLGLRTGNAGIRKDSASSTLDPGHPQAPSPARRANRRKLFVFLGVFVAVGAASLVYTFARPAEYRSSARLQINPGSVQVESLKPTGGSQGADAPRPLLTELQVLTSRPILEATAEKLSATSRDRLAALGPDTVAALQSSLEVSAADGTDVVEVAAVGTDPEFAAALVNGLVGTYKERLDQAYREASGESLAQINDEVGKLEAKVTAQRRVVEDFRQRHNVVSLEREENQLLARVRGQGTALNNANEKLATAEGRLRSIRESIAEGRSVVRARDDPTLANLEQRASTLREELREMERGYTPEYLALDNKVRAQRTRLAELERQIAAQRRVAQQSSLAEAEEEVSSAREAVNRIQQQMAGDRGAVQAFTARFNEYKTMREDLTQLESMHRDSIQRRAKLEAGERARRPSVRILEAATVPQQVWRPPYMRDAAISVVGSFLLALLVMWVVELFNRTDPQPTMLVPHPVAVSMLGGQIAERAPLPGYAMPTLDATATGLLTAEPSLPRELVTEEIGSLMAAATEDVRLAVVLLVGGLSPEELVALQWDDVDLAARQIRVPGDSPRTIDLFEPAPTMLARLPQAAGNRVLQAHGNGPITLERLTSDLLYAAHDAGIDHPAEVTPAALRHTYVAFLARQGIRLADLVTLVGRMSPEQAAVYSAFAPPGKRLELGEVNRSMPGIDATHPG